MKNINIKKLTLYVLISVLVITSVAYAVLQTTLSISGIVTKQGNTWSVYFTNLSNPILTGTAVSTNTKLQASSFTFNATLIKPLDSIIYTFDVKNSGTVNAQLDSVTLTGIANARANNITYTLTYSDGTQIAQGDKLNIGETKSLKLTVIFDNVSDISSNDVNLNLGATLIYIQSDK